MLPRMDGGAVGPLRHRGRSGGVHPGRRTSQTEYYDSATAGQQSIDNRYFDRRAGLTIEQALFDYENELADRLRELSALLGQPAHPGELLDIDLQSMLVPLPDGELERLQADSREQNRRRDSNLGKAPSAVPGNPRDKRR